MYFNTAEGRIREYKEFISVDYNNKSYCTFLLYTKTNLISRINEIFWRCKVYFLSDVERCEVTYT